ncbi:MAG: DUF3025 domain-containing protein [Ramlibacter sp.]
MLSQIDWSQPWFDAVRPSFERLQLRGDSFIDAFNAGASTLGLTNHRGQPIRFVPQAELPEGAAYEEFIGATGCVPTRDNLHDFFNGLVWQTFPLIKRELNALQAAQIAEAGVGKSRGPARDAATIFDENAALLVLREGEAGDALLDALRGHRWREALHARAGMFGREAELWLFGHALMEKLVAPRKAITAHVLSLRAPDEYFGLSWDSRRSWIDSHIAEQLRAEAPATSRFSPLPVLGVPGWWPGQDEAFYSDEDVFRPKRSK